MQHCEHCLASIKKSKLASKLDLSRSFTKIGNRLHLGIDRKTVCPVLTRYIPRTIVLAGNGAVKKARHLMDCAIYCATLCIKKLHTLLKSLITNRVTQDFRKNFVAAILNPSHQEPTLA